MHVISDLFAYVKFGPSRSVPHIIGNQKYQVVQAGEWINRHYEFCGFVAAVAIP